MKKSFKEIAKSKNKLLLIESFSFTKKDISLLDNSSNSILLESDGRKYNCFAVIKDIPITKFTENFNGRIYPRKLWERIHKQQLGEGTLCLADHPDEDSDGSVKDITGVWKNFRVLDENGIADLYLIKGHGERLYDVVNAGGAAGMSSVGYGDLLEDGKTVDSNTYELVRLADWVLFPSQGVYATNENLNEKNYTNKLENKLLKENRGNNNFMNETIEQVFISNFKNQSKAILRESRRALSNKDVNKINESKEKLSDFLSTIPNNILLEERGKIAEQIEELNDILKQNLEESNLKLNKNISDYNELKEKYNSSTEILKSLKEKHIKAKEVISLLSGNEKVMKEDINTAVSKLRKMEKAIKVLNENRKVMTYDLKKLIQERGNMLDDIKNFAIDKKSMLEDIKQFKKERSDMLYDIKCFTEQESKFKSELSKLKKENIKLKKKIHEELDDEMYDLPEDEPYDVQDEYYNDENYDIQVDDAINYQMDDEDYGSSYSGEDYYDMDEYSEKKYIKPKQKIIESSIRKIAPKKEIVDLYMKESKKRPGLKHIKNEIFNSKSLVEAFMKIKNFNSTFESKPIKLSNVIRESYDSSWLGKSR